MSKINIAFGVTQDWLKYTFITMCSILSHAGFEGYKFYIMCDISQDNFKKIFADVEQKLQHIHPFEVEYIMMNNSDFDGVVHDVRVGISAYYRLKLSDLINIDKVIYLDSDIVVNDNISQLWSIDIDNYLIGAVEDKYSALMTYRANLKDDDIYFNSGVMLMNLKEFRKQKVEEKIFKRLKEEDNDYSDQDVLNDICQKQILYLPLRYNLMLTTDDPNAFPMRRKEYDQSLKSPFILHYALKPWILPVSYSEYWRKYSSELYP